MSVGQGCKFDLTMMVIFFSSLWVIASPTYANSVYVHERYTTQKGFTLYKVTGLLFGPSPFSKATFLQEATHFT